LGEGCKLHKQNLEMDFVVRIKPSLPPNGQEIPFLPSRSTLIHSSNQPSTNVTQIFMHNDSYSIEKSCLVMKGSGNKSWHERYYPSAIEHGERLVKLYTQMPSSTKLFSVSHSLTHVYSLSAAVRNSGFGVPMILLAHQRVDF
jgi:hypothetical protein